MERTTAYTSILEAVDRGRSALLRSRLSRGLTRFICVGLGIVTFLVVWSFFQQAFSVFSVPLAALVTALALVGLLAALVRWIVLPLATMPNRDHFVSLVEKRYPESKNILVNAYQLGSDEALQKHERSQDLIRAVVSRADQSLDSFDLTTWSSIREDRRFLGLGSLAALTLLVMGIMATVPFKHAVAPL